MDIDKYSLIAVLGGDGTFHEVANGLMARLDKKKIPIAVIPNGSGDDFASALGIMTPDHALDYICKKEIIKVDSVRILLDHESEDTLPEGIERLNFCRYMMINSGASMPSLVAFKAKAWKACCGKTSYTIATLIEAIKGNIVPDIYELYVDGEKVKLNATEDLATILLMLGNGKYTGGGMIINPYACVNDGMIDVTWISDPRINNLTGISGMLD